MAYIGKSPTGAGVRSRFHFTATGGETSLSGADDNGKTLVFADGEYVDVYLNGVLLFDGDYNTTTANTIGGLDALTASDVVEIVVYDIFSVADTVSAKNGGTFNGDVTVSGTLDATSYTGDGSSLTGISSDLVDDTTPQLGGNLDVNGNEITSASNGDVTVNPNGTGDIILDANVGVNTSDPTTLGGGAKLTVNQGADGDAVFIRGGSTRQMILGTNASNAFIDTDNTSGLQLLKNGTEVVRVGNGSGRYVQMYYTDANEKFRFDLQTGKFFMDSEGGGANCDVDVRAGSAKQWVHFGFNNNAIDDSYNTTSITDNGTGQMGITINNDMDNASNHVFTGHSSSNLASNGVYEGDAWSKDAGSYFFYSHWQTTAYDLAYNGSAIWGDLA